MIEKTKQNKQQIITICSIFIISRIFILVAAILSITPTPDIIMLFDAEHYINIAKYGYYHELLTAFFPVVPLIIKFLSPYGMIFVSQLATIGTMFLIYDLIEDKNNKEKVFILSVFAFCPLSVYSIIPYTENLFVFLTMFAFYLFVKRKIGIGLGVIIGLCVATRNSGSMLFFAIFIALCYLWYKKEIKFIHIAQTYIPATIISCLYPMYLQIKFGNWKLFMDCQNAYWGKVDSNIFFLLKNQLNIIFNPNHYVGTERNEIEIIFYRMNEIITIIIGLGILGLGIYIIKKFIKNKSKPNVANLLIPFIYVALSMFCFTLSIRNPEIDSPSTSFFRYFLGLFPIYLAIGQLNTKVIRIILYLTILFTTFVAIFFYSNSFFY